MTKLKTDIVYIKSCKKENLIPSFAKVNLSIKSGGYKLKKKVAKLLMDTELQDKHYQIRKIRNEIRSIAISLKSSLGLILFKAVIYQVEVVRRSKLVAIRKRHEKKPFNFRRQNVNASHSAIYTRQIIHILSSYNLSRDEELALCYGLDQHIPNNSTRNTIKTEFELFYQGLLKTFHICQKNKLVQ